MPFFNLKSNYIKLFSVILISCLGIIVYSNTFHSSFHFDDDSSIKNNFVIRSIDHLQDIWIFLPRRFILYLSIAFNYHFNGLDVFGYHLFNLGVHLVSSMLVWWLTLLTFSTPAMKRETVFKNTFVKEFSKGGAVFSWLLQMGYMEKVSDLEGRPKAISDKERTVILKKYPEESDRILNILDQDQTNKITEHADLIALLAALVFVSHPLQTQAVTYIVQRAASMATLFYLASLCFYIKSRLLQDNRSALGLRRIYYIGAMIMAIIAMFTKETSITLPLMILLYEFSFFKTKKGFNWKCSIPFLIILLIIPVTMLITETGTMRSQELRSESGISVMQYLLTEFKVIVTYIRLAFLPLHQNLDYDYPISNSLFELSTFVSLSFIIAILFLAKFLFSKYRLVSFSILWFFLTLLPESSIFPIKDVIFEHRLYLPLVGYSIFLVSGVYYLLQKSTIKTMLIVLTMIIICNSFLTYQRNKVWKDEFTLWGDAVQKSPHKARGHQHLGTAYSAQGNLTQALSEYNKAIELDPHDMQTYNDRGNIYAEQKNYTKAMVDFTKAIGISPDFAAPYYNRGLIRSDQGNYIQAVSDYSKAIEIDPNYADAYNNRAVSYFELKEYNNAWDNIQKAEELGYAVNPGFITALKEVTGDPVRRRDIGSG